MEYLEVMSFHKILLNIFNKKQQLLFFLKSSFVYFLYFFCSFSFLYFFFLIEIEWIIFISEIERNEKIIKPEEKISLHQSVFNNFSQQLQICKK